MKCLLIRPGQQPEEAVISDDLQSIQRFLGGPVEAIPFSLDWAAILSNANGPFHEDAEPNRIHKGKRTVSIYACLLAKQKGNCCEACPMG